MSLMSESSKNPSQMPGVPAQARQIVLIFQKSDARPIGGAVLYWDATYW